MQQPASYQVRLGELWLLRARITFLLLFIVAGTISMASIYVGIKTGDVQKTNKALEHAWLQTEKFFAESFTTPPQPTIQYNPVPTNSVTETTTNTTNSYSTNQQSYPTPWPTVDYNAQYKQQQDAFNKQVEQDNQKFEQQKQANQQWYDDQVKKSATSNSRF